MIHLTDEMGEQHSLDAFSHLHQGRIRGTNRYVTFVPPLAKQLEEAWIYQDSPAQLRLRKRDEAKWRRAPFNGRFTQLADGWAHLRHDRGQCYSLHLERLPNGHERFRLFFLDPVGTASHWSTFRNTMALVAWFQHAQKDHDHE